MNLDTAQLYIGLMSGTSLDGIDAAIILTDGKTIDAYITNLYQPYDQAFQQKLHLLISGQSCDWLMIEQELTKLHAKAVADILLKANMNHKQIQAIGFHGQTIIHRPLESITWQIGNGALLTHLTNINVICDFRRRDVAAGGNGAPLVPIFHQAMLHDVPPPYIVLNIGGISNITYVGPDDEIIAFDCGPANAIINDACVRYFGLPYDDQGLLANQGVANEEFIAHYLNDEYFKRSIPKSLDRNNFKTIIDDIERFEPASLPMRHYNIIASLTKLAAQSISLAISNLPTLPTKLYIAGGGTKNICLINMVKQTLSSSIEISEFAIDNLEADFIEAQAFAFLAARVERGLPISFPNTTGNHQASCGAASYRF